MEQKGINVLIIGKDWKDCRKLKRFLKKKGVEAHFFLDSIEAMIYLGSIGSADILIAEFDMSNLNAMGIIKMTKKWLPRMVRICLSNNSSHEDISIQGGFDHFFQYPVDKDLLWREMLKLFEWKKDAVLE